jgi:hypothetical protein
MRKSFLRKLIFWACVVVNESMLSWLPISCLLLPWQSCDFYEFFLCLAKFACEKHFSIQYCVQKMKYPTNPSPKLCKGMWFTTLHWTLDSFVCQLSKTAINLTKLADTFYVGTNTWNVNVIKHVWCIIQNFNIKSLYLL